MESLLACVAIIGTLLIGAMSPGPSFVMVARTAIAASRLDGISAAVGMGVGGLIFAGAALLGLHLVLASVPWAYAALKIAGAAYLFYLAFLLWKGAREPVATADQGPNGSRSVRKSILIGLATQLSNPKTAIVYASIFTALLPPDHAHWVALVILPAVFAIEAGWYALVAIAFSAPRPRQTYLRAKPWIDRIAASVMGLLGIKLVAEAAV
jgi:threonine/homoserine/homoserine lactone efflux protein